MNLKKYIKLKNENADKPVRSEKEQERYEALYAQVKANEEAKIAAKKRINIWQILTPIATVTAATIIAVTCILVSRKPNNFIYGVEDIKHEITTFDTLQENVKFFNLSQIENDITQVSLAYDSKSNDNLYYRTIARIGLSELDLDIVINEKFNYDFEIKDEITKTLTDYSLTYNRTEYSASNGIDGYTYLGKIAVQTETVYFEYTQIPALGDEAFFESIQQIIQVKK